MEHLRINDNRPDALSLERLPDEMIGHILYYLSPEDNLHGVQLVSRRFYRLANEPLLWRYHCRTCIKYWSPHHRFEQRVAAAAQKTYWKWLYIRRSNLNRQVSSTLDEIIRTKVHRGRGFETISRLGYDAKDVLLEHCQAPTTAEDWIARRYFANRVLDAVHKYAALEEWDELSQSPPAFDLRLKSQQLERALGAFDLFVLHDQPGDLDDIARMLDEIATSFRLSHAGLQNWSTRTKALTLVRWLRARNLTGLNDPHHDYRNLRNCLIGQALRHPEHDSLPIVSAAIFCCVAARLGIDASSCSFPSHVHVIISAPAGYTLDGGLAGRSDSSSERMFLDPYGSDDEVQLARLESILAQLGFAEHTEQFTTPVPASKMAIRVAHNVSASLGIPELHDRLAPRVIRLLRGDGLLNASACWYAASWALLILSRPNRTTWLDRLEKFLKQFPDVYPEDAWMVEKFLWPRFCEVISSPRDGFRRHHNRPGGPINPWHFWQGIRDLDGIPPPIYRRDRCHHPSGPLLRIGQVFRHRRYRWLGVVTSWDERESQLSHFEFSPEIPADAPPVLPGTSRYVFFYSCLAAREAEPHIISASNIQPITDPTLVTEGMFPTAGKYFKRFDAATCRFVSNIREEFPQD
ncbi:Transglutaminase-like superfamily domain-containing protein [Trichoderma austrokoningii]